MGRKFAIWDFVSMALCLCLLIAALLLNRANGSRFWNPFV